MKAKNDLTDDERTELEKFRADREKQRAYSAAYRSRPEVREKAHERYIKTKEQRERRVLQRLIDKYGAPKS